MTGVLYKKAWYEAMKTLEFHDQFRILMRDLHMALCDGTCHHCENVRGTEWAMD